MICNIEGIYNGKVMVNYNHGHDCVIIQNQLNGAYTCIDNNGGMKEWYDLFKENMTAETDYETSLRFFTQNLKEIK